MPGKVKVFLVLLFLVFCIPAPAVGNQNGGAFAGLDLHLSAGSVISHQLSTGRYALVFEDGFSMSVGGNHFSSDKAVVWLESITTESRGRVRIYYTVKAYMEGSFRSREGSAAKSVDITKTVVGNNRWVILFSVNGEVFVTAENRQIKDPSQMEFYKKALAASEIKPPAYVVRPEAMVPQWHRPVEAAKAKVKDKAKPAELAVKPEPPADAATEKTKELLKKVPPAKAAKPVFEYPVHLSPAGQSQPQIESAPDGQRNIATVTGRFYIWQKQDEQGGLLQLQADCAVIFYSQQQTSKDNVDLETALSNNAIEAVYLSGDVIMTQDRRTIQADELYYDFKGKKALAINAVMRNFDTARNIPIYIRAAKIRQVAQNQFAAEDVVVTNSEFYRPQISLTASNVVVTDTTAIDERSGQLSDDSYDVLMEDIRLKAGNTTILRWPRLRSNAERSDTALRSAHISNDNTWGTSIETQWYLYRLLGLREPEGVDGTLMLDYFGKRGPAAGAEIEYSRENYYGRLLGYIIRDRGTDNVGRMDARRNLDPGEDIRGRFGWLHRQFLPHKWQLTTAIDYQSDENFLESFYRSEFAVTGRPETYLHLKRIEDNRGISILVKPRLNDFEDYLEELPSVEYHLVGQSVFDDVFTLYSDSQVSRFRQRIGDGHTTMIDEGMFSFVSHRTELDMPILTEGFKIVPFVAGNFGYDDRSGFQRSLVDGRFSGSSGENTVMIGEIGLRVSARPLHRVYPNVQSRLWDLDKLRHIIKPQLTAAAYGQSDNVVDQADIINIGLSQRLQTKRGPAGDRRTVDWMRLDTDVTFVEGSGHASDGPDRFIWAKPIVPMRVMSAPDIFHGDLGNPALTRFELFGPRRDYFSADYSWRISDTTMIISDLHYDLQSDVVQQFNIGLSRLCWPDLSFYIGNRYLRRVNVLNEKGSNAFTFAATYIIDPRYTFVFAQQYDFDYGANIRSDITLIRRYHRVNYSLTFSSDESLKEQAIIFGLWPQGVPELAFGRRKYADMDTPD